MAKFDFKGLVLLVAAAGIGGAAMWKFDDYQFRHQVDTINAQLLKGTTVAAVDVHKIGLHGPWIDIHHDIDCGDLPSAKEKLEVGLADAKAKEVFGTPGGAYTTEDIRVNGLVPPSIRFNNVTFTYTLKPLPGQPYDPILKTRSSGAFDWSVCGQIYHFASIPSLEEFVMRAKKDKSILPPSAYIEKSSEARVASR